MTLKTAIIASAKPSKAATSEDGESDADDDRPLSAIAKKAILKTLKVRRRLLAVP
jgi:hypothetical protein